MAHATLNAQLVSQACIKTLAGHSILDSNTATRKIVERLKALALAAASNGDDARQITMSDEEFILIAHHWDGKATVVTPIGLDERRAAQRPLAQPERRKARA